MAVVKAIPYEGVTYRSAAICRVMTGSKRRKHGRESHPRRPRSSAGPLTSSPGRRPAAGHALPPCDEDREALKKMIIPNRPISRIEIIFFSRESSSTKKRKVERERKKWRRGGEVRGMTRAHSKLPLISGRRLTCERLHT